MAHRNMKGRKKPKVGGMRKSLRNEDKLKKVKRNARRLKDEKQKAKLAKEPGVEPQVVAAEDSTPKLKGKEARVARMTEKQSLSLYPGNERVLLVGEGNLSFALALCKKLGKGEGIYATNVDDEATLKKKYPDYEAACKELDELGATVLAGVDATQLHKVKEFRKAFSKIVWNFPHLGGVEQDQDKIAAAHRLVLTEFALSAAKCLIPNERSAIYITIKQGEPYKSWKIPHALRAACPELELKTAVPFNPTAWPGYAHRRTLGFDARFSKADSEELAKGAKTYVFSPVLRKAES